MSAGRGVHSVVAVEKKPVTVRIARWSAEHPWRAIALWVVFVAVCFVGVTLTGDPDPASDRLGALTAATADVQSRHPDLRVEETGGPSISKAMDDTLGQDFKRAEYLSLPVTFAILIVAFGALIAAGVPVLLALSS